jgi:RNA polymerase sigma factor (sigma-70 family)
VRHRKALEKGCLAAGCRGPGLDDALQESLVRAVVWIWRHPDHVDELGESWFYAVGVRTGVDQHRRESRARMRERRVDHASGDSDSPETVEAEPFSELVRREEEAALWRAYRRLPEPERRVIDALVFRDLSLREASRALGLSRPTILARYGQGLARLRWALDEVDDG